MSAHVDVDVAADDNLAAVYKGANIASGTSSDNDLSAGHATPVSAVCGAEVVSCVAVDAKFTSLHTGSGKGVNVSVHGDLAALHPCTNVHIGVAVDNDLACGHLHADVLDPGEIAVNDDLRLCRGCSGPTRDLKEFSEPVLLPSDIDGEVNDLFSCLSCEYIGADAVSLEEQLGLVCYGECNGFHPSLHLTVWHQPQSRRGWARNGGREPRSCSG